jgi:hypothetical protein
MKSDEMKAKIEQTVLDRILFIGDKLPELREDDNRVKYVLLGLPADHLDELAELARRAVLEAKKEAIDETIDRVYEWLPDDMKDAADKHVADRLAELEAELADQTTPKDKEIVE